MKKIYLIAIGLIPFCCCLAQNETPVDQANEAYHYDVRARITVPPYGLERVQGLVKKIKYVEIPSDGADKGLEALHENVYNALSLREKFTYNMIHAESYSQTCSMELPVPDERKKLFGQLLNVFGENGWSGRQYDFFKENRDSVIQLMRESIGRSSKVGLNYKYVIIDLDATELIPVLISTYLLKKEDHDILTVLMLLMRDNKYPPFMGSASYQKLYASRDSDYRTCLVFNQANEDLVIKRATDFYNGLSK